MKHGDVGSAKGKLSCRFVREGKIQFSPAGLPPVHHGERRARVFLGKEAPDKRVAHQSLGLGGVASLGRLDEVDELRPAVLPRSDFGALAQVLGHE